MQNKSAPTTNSKGKQSWVALLVIAVAVVCYMNYQEASSSPTQHNRQPERLEQDEDGVMMVPYVPDCGADEESKPGVHPSCEPTCANPKPACIKVFSFDFAPCFCKAPLVRDTKSKRCVQRSDCPPQRA